MQMVNNSGQNPVAPFYFTAAAIGYQASKLSTLPTASHSALTCTPLLGPQPEVMDISVGIGPWFSWIPDFGAVG